METQDLALRATRLAFTGIGAVAPEPMAALAERMYFTPRRRRMPARERAFLEDATSFTVATSAGPLSGWRWTRMFPWERAERGTVLLAHGWEGRAAQLGGFVRPLLQRGFSIIAVDAPAHGASPGDAVDLPTYARVLRDVADEDGEVCAVIAHSFGGAATVLALADLDIDVRAAVLVAPPSSLLRFADQFARIVGLTRATEAIFRARLEERFGREWWRTFALDTRAAELASVPSLIIHDANDKEIPVDEGRALAGAWPGAVFHETAGLGHHRVLRDDDLAQRAAAFIDESVSSAPLVGAQQDAVSGAAAG